jgi:hypothetical protein
MHLHYIFAHLCQLDGIASDMGCESRQGDMSRASARALDSSTEDDLQSRANKETTLFLFRCFIVSLFQTYIGIRHHPGPAMARITRFPYVGRVRKRTERKGDRNAEQTSHKRTANAAVPSRRSVRSTASTTGVLTRGLWVGNGLEIRSNYYEQVQRPTGNGPITA